MSAFPALEGSDAPDAPTYDCIVIGAGPVGTFAASLLGAYGTRTLVLERDVALFAAPRAVAMDDESARLFGTLSTPLVEWVDAHNSRVPVEIRIGVPAAGGVAMVGPVIPNYVDATGFEDTMFFHQPLLEAQLRGLLAASPSVSLRLGVAVESVTPVPGGVEVTCRDAATGVASVYRCSYLVAADGGSSGVRKQLGIPFAGDSFPDPPWLVVDMETEDAALCAAWPTFNFINLPPDGSKSGRGRLRSVVHVPLPGNTHGRRFEFLLYPGEDPVAMQTGESVTGLLASLGVLPSSRFTIIRTAVYTFHARVAADWVAGGGRVVLMGDAAHCMPPFRGQGMCSGLRDASNVCWKIAAAVAGARGGDAGGTANAGKDVSGSDSGGLLSSYQMEREPHLRSVTATAVTMGRLITLSSPRWVWHARNAVVTALYHCPLTQPFFKAPFSPPTALGAGLFDFHEAVGWAGQRGLRRRGRGQAASSLPSDDNAAEATDDGGGWVARDYASGRSFPNFRVGTLAALAAGSMSGQASRFDALITAAQLRQQQQQRPRPPSVSATPGGTTVVGTAAAAATTRGRRSQSPAAVAARAAAARRRSGKGPAQTSAAATTMNTGLGSTSTGRPAAPLWALVFPPHVLSPSFGHRHPVAALAAATSTALAASAGGGGGAAGGAPVAFTTIQLLPAVGWEGRAARHAAALAAAPPVSTPTSSHDSSLPTGIEVVAADITGKLQLWFWGARGDVAIVRPDRMVYGVYEAGELSAALAELQARMGGGQKHPQHQQREVCAQRPSYWPARGVACGAWLAWGLATMLSFLLRWGVVAAGVAAVVVGIMVGMGEGVGGFGNVFF